MRERPISGPDQGQALLGLHDQVLVAELRAAFIRDVVQIGHKHQMATAFRLALARALGMKRLVPYTFVFDS